mmetsp:Transcript_42824/g.85852  ORF Transcript_42824/g.85852 Transcript_42824/m.85852 type:complete len:290 (-) Transcript_42824:297-1166(-)
MRAEAAHVGLAEVEQRPVRQHRQQQHEPARQHRVPHARKPVVVDAFLVALDLLVDDGAQRLAVLAQVVQHVLDAGVDFALDVLAQLVDLVRQPPPHLLRRPLREEHRVQLEGVGGAHAALQLLHDLRHHVGAVHLVARRVELGQVVGHLRRVLERQPLYHVHAPADEGLADGIEEDHDHGGVLRKLVDDLVNVEGVLERAISEPWGVDELHEREVFLHRRGKLRGQKVHDAVDLREVFEMRECADGLWTLPRSSRTPTTNDRDTCSFDRHTFVLDLLPNIPIREGGLSS